jgi:hypothetical protein
MNADNLNTGKPKASRHFRKKNMEYLTDKINGPETRILRAALEPYLYMDLRRVTNL